MAASAQTAFIAPAPTGFWARYFRPSPPDQPSREWHVSPAIDMAAYHFSWAWVLVPMLLTGSYLWFFYLYALVMGANLAHRHFGLPYAYLDGEIFRGFRRQLTWFPLLCLIMLAVTPLLLMGSIAGQAVGAVVFFSALWNFYHTYLQKFGILRLYLAKDSAPERLKTPAWVDKYFLFCWFPLYFSYLGPHYKNLILLNAGELKRSVSAIILFMEKCEAWTVFPSALIAAGGVGLWLWHEGRGQRFQNHARLSAAAGTLLISTALFWANPIEAFIAFAFSHAAEYMVFVWAYQRRRYSRPRPSPSIMQRVLRYPTLWYGGFTVILVGAGICQVMWGHTIMQGVKPIAFLGMTGGQWFFYYAVYESLIHFHMDGFLWKMRRPEVRENI